MQSMMERLEGTWEGEGRGEYPTIDDFTYSETVSLARLADKPVLFYTQRTRSPEGKPLHAETGYYRFDDDAVELVIAQPTGIVEAHRGRFDGDRIVFHQVGLASTPTAVEVQAVQRSLTIKGDVLAYTLDMAAVGQPLTFHLEARLERRA